MAKYTLTTDADGWITIITPNEKDGVELDAAIVKQIIIGASKLVDGVLLYRISHTDDADGYIDSIGTDAAGTETVTADDLASVVRGASKLVDGKVVTDAAKVAELAAAAEKVTPTAEQQMIAALSLQVAQMKGAQA